MHNTAPTRVLWVEVGRVFRNLRSALVDRDFELVELLEFAGPDLNRDQKSKVRHWTTRADVVVLCSSPDTLGPPAEFFSTSSFILGLGRALIRVESSQNGERLNIVDRPGHYSRSILNSELIEGEERLYFVLSAYRGRSHGFNLPANQPLHIFECPIAIQPHEFAALLGNPDELSKIPDRLFEQLVADLLSADGWNVDLIARNNAPGPDIVATTSKSISGIPQKMIVECKRHRIDRPVDINVVRKVMYWVNDEYRSTLGMIATTSGFTKLATLEATERHPWRLKLMDQHAIADWIKQSFKNSAQA